MTHFTPEHVEEAVKLFGDDNPFHRIGPMKERGKKPIIQGIHLLTEALSHVTDEKTPSVSAYFVNPLSAPAEIDFSSQGSQFFAKVNGVDAFNTADLTFMSMYSSEKFDSFAMPKEVCTFQPPNIDEVNLYQNSSFPQIRFFLAMGLMTKAIFEKMQEFTKNSRENTAEEKARGLIVNKGYLPAYRSLYLESTGNEPQANEKLNYSVSVHIDRPLIPNLEVLASGSKSGPLYKARVGTMLLPENKIYGMAEDL